MPRKIALLVQCFENVSGIIDVQLEGVYMLHMDKTIVIKCLWVNLGSENQEITSALDQVHLSLKLLLLLILIFHSKPLFAPLT